MFDFAFDCKKFKIHGLLLWNSNMSISEILLKNIDEKST